MNITLYIIGTSHPLQCGSADCDQAAITSFEEMLRTTCKTRSIRRIAEEMTHEGLKRYGVTETVGERVAKDFGIIHQNVDLSLEERQRFSLDDNAILSFVLNRGFSDGGDTFRKAFTELAHEVRERCWSGRIIAGNEWPALFVCGADHVRNVYKLWCRLGLDATVIHKDYDPCA